MVSEHRAIGAREEQCERLSDQATARMLEHRRAGEVDLGDATHDIERAVRDRSEVVQIGVSGPRIFEQVMRFPQLLVLRFELRLMNFEIVDEAIALLEQAFDLVETRSSAVIRVVS